MGNSDKKVKIIIYSICIIMFIYYVTLGKTPIIIIGFPIALVLISLRARAKNADYFRLIVMGIVSSVIYYGILFFIARIVKDNNTLKSILFFPLKF